MRAAGAPARAAEPVLDWNARAVSANLAPAPGSASTATAVATAAHHVLTGLTPALPVAGRDQLDAAYLIELAAIRR
jgi:hypothetical protein